MLEQMRRLSFYIEQGLLDSSVYDPEDSVRAASARALAQLDEPVAMRKLVDIKYAGYVGQEFIPTRDPLAGLKDAVRLCDV